jgi:hypothetical protein
MSQSLLMRPSAGLDFQERERERERREAGIPLVGLVHPARAT